MLGVISSCNQPDKNAATKDATVVADGNIDTRTTVRDNGVLIDYTDTKKGDTVLLFVHGWAIDKSYFADQVTFFQDRYRVVTVDLPGYGRSGRNRNSWTISDFARDLDSVMTELSLDKVILLGHSMSGDIVLNAALRDTQRVIAVVGIDNFKNVGVPENPKDSAGFAAAIQGMKQHFASTASAFVNQALFSKDTDSSTRKRVLADVTHSDSSIAVATLESQRFDEVASLKRWRRPLYLVNSDYQPTDTSFLHRSAMPFHLLSISRSGHFPMIERPEEFNKALQLMINSIGTQSR